MDLDFFKILILIVILIIPTIMLSNFIKTSSDSKIEINSCYKFETNDPFKEDIVIKIVNKKNNFVQYAFDVPNANLLFSTSAFNLNKNYKKVECKNK